MNNNVITYQLSKNQKKILDNLLKSESMYNVLNAGRQSGKTFVMSRLATILALTEPNSKTLVVAPYSSQSDTFFFNVMQIERIGQLISKIIRSPYKTVEFSTGASIDFRSADNPKSIRSKSYNFIFLDEFAFFKKDAFDLAITPTLIASGDKCKLFFSSTPNGLTGLFYDLYLKGINPNETNYTYNYMNFNDNPNRNMDFINAEEMRLPSNRFRQEFLGEFVSDGGDVFQNIDNVLVLDNMIKSIPNAQYYAGIDWGRSNDNTVLTILNRDREVAFCKSYSGNWNKQLDDIMLILKDYKPIVYAESNGIGDPLIDQARKGYSNITPFITSNNSKKEIIENLKMIILKEEIKLPSRKANLDLFKELSNYTYSITKTGLISYHHRDGEHDDFVDSLAIANHCYDKHTVGFNSMQYAKRNNFYS